MISKDTAIDVAYKYVGKPRDETKDYDRGVARGEVIAASNISTALKALPEQTVLLQFSNPQCVKGDKVKNLHIAPEMVPDVVMWYNAFYAGDNYTVKIDGVKQKVDENGYLVVPA